MDLWDRPKSMIHSDKYEELIHTLNFLGLRKFLYHLSTVLVLTNFLCNMSSKRLWSTMSKATL